jgi:hypothetical protein
LNCTYNIDHSSIAPVWLQSRPSRQNPPSGDSRQIRLWRTPDETVSVDPLARLKISVDIFDSKPCCKRVPNFSFTQLNFLVHPVLQQATRLYHLKHMMIDALEKRLIEALKSVDVHGDVAPAHVHDPMTMLLRENVVRDNLVRWDGVRGRYVLTGTGRRRISQGSRAPGAVVSFRVVAGSALHRKSANINLKE